MRLKAALKLLDTTLDCGVITKKESIYYLTGFFPTAFAVLVIDDKPYLAVSEMDAALTEDIDIEVSVVKSFKKELSFKGRVGVEKRHTTLSFVEEFLKGCELEDMRFISEMRQVKDRSELERIGTAIQITEKMLGSLTTVGGTERDAAAELRCRISKKSEVAFDPIVAAGKNSAIPHHFPGDKEIVEANPVIVDLGAQFEGYNCDMTRTFCQSPGGRFKEVYRAVVEAQKEGIKHLRPGSRCSDCDAVVREVLKQHELEGYFLHSTGHGIGLEVHEAPRISKDADDTFKEGMVVTIEPGVYIPGWGGVRIEDVVLVDKNPLVLTNYPKLDL